MSVIKNYISSQKQTTDIDIYRQMFEDNMQLYVAELGIYNFSSEQVQQNKNLYFYNIIRDKLRTKTIHKIHQCLSSHNIPCIYFKGICFATLLLPNRLLRHVGDIDLFIEPDYYDEAYRLLTEDNVGLQRANKSEDEDHHISLIDRNNNMVVELHRSFVSPKYHIQNLYLVNHTMTMNIDGVDYRTLDYSACFLYQLYHLYMHINDDLNDVMLDVFLNKSLLDWDAVFKKYADRYTKNIVELAMLVEKYHDKIRWEEVNQEIKANCATDVLCKIIEYDLSFLDEGLCRDKVENLLNDIRTSIRLTNNEEILTKMKTGEDIVNILNENLTKYHSGTSLAAKKGQEYKFTLDEFSEITNPNHTYVFQGTTPPTSALDCSAKVSMVFRDDTLSVTFEVQDDVVVFNEKDDDDPYHCDCIGMMIVVSGANHYKYNYLFTLLKQDEETKWAQCRDILELQDLTKEQSISSLRILPKGYKITHSIKYSYLQFNPDTDKMYVDFVICDCDDKQTGRKTTMSLYTNAFLFYDPRTYMKVVLN